MEGFARCVDWSIAFMKSGGAERLRAAEKEAKEKRLRLWKDYQSNTPQVSAFSYIDFDILSQYCSFLSAFVFVSILSFGSKHEC